MSDAPLFLGGLAVPAYFVGAAALGALSMGHEYTGRTLNLLLSLPARRSRLLANKLAVLAMMQLALGGVAYTLVFGDARLPQTARDTASLVPALCGLFVAPWLTMVCRSAIGGAVFAMALPGTLLVMGELIGTSLYGQGSGMQAFRLTFVWLGTLALCVVGAVLGWWTFMRLEVIDGPAEHLSFARLLQSSASTQSTARVTRRHPIVLLVTKELHLQQLPVAIAVIFVLIWIAVVGGTTWAAHPAYGSAIIALTILYGGLLPLVIGASASAGERQMGTLEWQVMQPISASKQWWIKVGIVLGLSMTLALGLPMLLMYFADLARVTGAGPFGEREWWIVMPVMLLASGSLYVSSLSSSTLWALVMSVPAALGPWIFLNVTMDWFRISWFPAATRNPTVLTLLLVTGFIAIVLRFAFTNHRSADRPDGRVWTQIVLLAASVTAGVMTVALEQAVRR